MKYLNGNKIVSYNVFNKNILTKVGSGLEVDAYSIDGVIVKFYKNDPYMSRISKESVEKMKLIKTERILLPMSYITNMEGNIQGYTMKKIIKSNRKSFFKLDRDSLINEAKKIQNDIKILNKNKLVVADLHSNNIIYNKGIYFIDPGKYKFYKKENFREYLNYEQIDEFLLELLLEYNEDKYKNEEYSLFAYKELRKFLIKNNYMLLDYIINDFEYDNLDELVKSYNKKVI